MQGLETALDNMFKKLPHLPENGKKGLANALPWLALAGGILSLLGAWYIFSVVNSYGQLASDLYVLSGYSNAVSGYVTFAWISVAILVAQAALMLIAFPSLRTHKRLGWSLLLWSAFANIVYDVVYNLFGYGYVNIGSLVFSLIGAAIGLYLLFEVRSYFTGAGSAAPKAPEAK